MKLVGFVGSPRKGGNTDVLVRQVLDGASAAGAETGIFYLNELNIEGCQGCNGCKANAGCRLRDDMTSLYDELADAEGIVLGSPVYLSYISGQTKIFLDRCHALRHAGNAGRPRQGKKAVLVFSQANPDKEHYRLVFAGLAEFLCAGGLEVQDILVAAGFEDAGAVANDGVLMQEAREAGEKLAKVIKMAQIFKKTDAVSGPSKARRNRE